MIKKICLIATLIFATSSAAAEKKIMLFGGPNNTTYLGCMNCSHFATDSIHNEFGTYGSDMLVTSIFNDFGQYGSSFSSYSACNELAANPPVVVDQDGVFYGYLTLNNLNPRAITEPRIVAWLKYKVCKK